MLSNSLFLWSLAALIGVLLAILGFILYVAARQAHAKPGADPKLVKLRFDSLRNSFRNAVDIIEANIAARSERYGIPWVLVLNEGQTNSALPIEQSGVASALSSEAATAAATNGIAWHFFDKGVVVEMQGAYLGSPDDESSAEKPWDEFLGLCRNYRPQRPFDSVVITVPARLLLDNGPDAQLELVKLARLSHRRLWLAQNRFAMRFAVYIAVSGCESIEGFSAFARALPESMRAGILGWSSPYDLSTTYQGSWVEDAVDDVVHTLADASAELFTHFKGGADARKFFLLPSRVDALRAQLQAYTDELMRPSAYHEPFFFRGIYFTGDSSQSAQLVQGAEAEESPLGEERPGAPELVSALMQEPAFLKDLFERKIFLEYGLARPSRQQLARPVLTRLARGTAVLVLGGWTLSMFVATLQLARRETDLAATLQTIESDARFRNQAMARGDTVPADWYRVRTLNLLAAIERHGAEKVWSFALPGSWHYWDDVEARAVARIEREFGEIAIGTLRRELYAKASALTGVQQDDSTSELIIGGECSAPEVLGLKTRKPTLAVDDQAEMLALQQYLGSVERLDHALGAMQRLLKSTPNDDQDLRLLVKYTLGADLPDNISQSIQYFRGGERNASVSVAPIQLAVRCSMGKGMAALQQRLFNNNDLLVQERQFAALQTRLLAPDALAATFAQTTDGLKELLAVVQQEDNLLAGGRSGWMHSPSADLGAGYQGLLLRIAQLDRLLGPDLAEQLKQQTAAEYQKFAAEFAQRFGADTGSGIAWQDKDARYTLSPERLALRDAVTNLLAQNFMTAPRGRELPEIPAQSILSWDPAMLDQALGFVDGYRRFVAEGLIKFPPEARASMGVFVAGQFAQLVNDRVVDAFSVSGRVDPANMTDATAFDAARGRLVKLQAFLTELGAPGLADNLQRAVAQDALARLNQVNHNLNQADLYAVRGGDFNYWNGDRAPVLQAFGLPDSQALSQYLALQSSRIEALARQADIYLPSLDHAQQEGRLAQRWLAISKELERYRLKNPNSTLLIYELFLTTSGVEMDRSNCSEKLASKQPGSRPADYFAEHHLALYNALQKRCAELRLTELHDQWSAFSVGFNSLLAGRYPFASSSAKDVTAADYEDAGQLFRVSEKLTHLLREPATGGRHEVASSAVQKFSDQYERVRAFMAPLYPTEEGVQAGYDLAVEFRSNQAAEVNGNKVIDWSLEVGTQALSLRDPPRLLHWEPGMPVTLTLRLAKDVPDSALPDAQQAELVADGKTVRYQYTDTWSLLRLIARQRDSDSGGRADNRSQLLRMEFPMGVEQGKGAAPESRARVYLRLTLSASGKRTPLAWPAVFPVRAPDFSSP